jgi:amino acid adenylation domain-containing protein
MILGSSAKAGDWPGTTVIDWLLRRATLSPHAVAYLVLDDAGREGRAITWGELDRRARSLAVHLCRHGVANEPVLLLFPTGIDYLIALFGCMYSGCLAVPLYPPRSSRHDLRIRAAARDSRAGVALWTGETASSFRAHRSRGGPLDGLTWLASDDLGDDLSGDWERPKIAEDSAALLQYTSGSTADPRGVVVTHGNLLENQKLIRSALGVDEAVSVVGWLPLYHDMGLIGSVIHTLYAGHRCVLMSPFTFLRDPSIWLEAISRHRAVISGGPNFAFEYCASRVTDKQKARLDLKSWRVAFNGSEPVRAETMERFARAFAPCGFDRDAFLPCYGLAESTLFVSAGGAARGYRCRSVDAAALRTHLVRPARPDAGESLRLVGCGRVGSGHEVAIVDPERCVRCVEGRVGEIWVCGASVARGYWDRPEETELHFRARLADTGEGPFLRTGDLGCFLDGELVVTGRLKDIIIIRGANHYPQDIERAAEESHAGLQPGGGAAFSVEGEGQELLCLVHEVRRDYRRDAPEEIVAVIRRAVSERCGVHVHGIALLRPGQIPRTSSGKIRRHACREEYLQGSLEVFFQSETTPPLDSRVGAEDDLTALDPAVNPERTKEILRRAIADCLHVAVEEIRDDLPLVALGIDSMAAIELLNSLERRFSVRIPPRCLLDRGTLDQLWHRLVEGELEAGCIEEEAVGPEGAEESPSLSHGERSLWFLHKLFPETTAYNLGLACRIESGLDVARLEQSLEILSRRHEALRTAFGESDGQPVRRVLEDELRLDRTPAANWDERQLRDAIVAEIHQPFDLTRGPLCRARLFLAGAGRDVLVLSVHHIVMDLWTADCLIRELSEVYAGLAAGLVVDLPSPPPFRRFVILEQKRLEGPDGERLWAYWLRKLSGEPPVLRLPTDRPRPAAPSFAGRSLRFSLDPRTLQDLDALAREEGATRYQILLAAFTVLLQRYSHQEDLWLGSAAVGRTHPEFDDLAGYCTNPLVLRADLSDDPPFRSFLAQVRRTVLEALDHQGMPLTLLVDRINPRREASGSPLFQAAFQLFCSRRHPHAASFLLGHVGHAIDLGGMVLWPLRIDHPTARFDLTMTLAKADEALEGLIEYRTVLFDEDTIRRMAAHFGVLVRSIASSPEERVSRLPILTEDERREVLIDWNATDARFPGPECVPQLFEEQVRRTPGATALLFGSDVWDYAELNRRANRLAHRLRRLGVGPETRVGLLLRRSPRLIVGLLATWKAGGAFVPLDPGYPSGRLEFLMADSGVSVLITEAALDRGLPTHRVAVLNLDSGVESLADALPETDSEPVAAPENLAYVIYTSGSTGTPKGVLVEHGGVRNLGQAQAGRLGIRPNDRVLQFASIGFDAAVSELCLALTTGAALVLVPEEAVTSADELHQLVDESSVTVATFPPALLDVLPAGLPTLRLLISAGEECMPSIVRKWAVGRTLVNAYGPTEATVCVSMAECDPRRDGPPPIGRPLANVRAYVLDRHGEAVPIGVPGELYVGGVAIARGYHRRPALTAECFLPDPFSSKPGTRMYRTGDLVRWRPGGTLEYLGRRDHQVKVRGFRVEPGEIEAALAGHPLVGRCAVVLQGADSGHKKLVAYVVASQGPPDGGRCDLELRAEYVDQWRTLYEEEFADRRRADDPALDAAGWNCSVTGLPFPAAEMKEWRDRAAERLLGLRPRRVLEIGCGTGLLLLQVAPHCTHYLGTDVSAAVLTRLRDNLRACGLGHVALEHRPADDFTGIDPQSFDLVVLNSVIQYFPDVKYLRQVLAGAARAVGPKGVIFVGDVRNRDLLEAFHTYVQVRRTGERPDDASGLREAVRRAVEAERELTVAPTFFRTVCDGSLGLSHAEVWLKRGRSRNEMTYYRYDVLLYVGTAPRPLSVEGSWHWGLDVGALAAIEERLVRGRPHAIEVLGIPNARVMEDLSRWKRMQSAAPPDQVGDAEGAADPEALWDLGSRLGYSVRVRWSCAGDPGRMDVLFEHPCPGSPPAPWPAPVSRSDAVANDPLRALWECKFGDHLRAFLKARLPAYMVPAAFVTVQAMPLTPHGKVDRAALAVRAPERRAASGEPYSPPQTPDERLLAGIWGDLLGLDRVDVHDNFFALGGDSILGIQVVSRANRAGLRLRAVDVFAHQTLSELACAGRSSDPPAAPSSTRDERPTIPDPSSHFSDDIERVSRLSPVQEGFLFHTMLESTPGMYLEQLAFRIRGDLDVPCFERAWQHVVERQPALRSSFEWEGLERPVRRVHRRVDIRIERPDLGGNGDPRRSVPLDEFLRSDRDRPFDLQQAPAYRLSLIDIGGSCHQFVWSFHHISLDGWSVPIVLSEVFRAYKAFCKGLPPVLDPVPDVEHALARSLAGDGADAEPFWRAYLDGLAGPTPLPVVRPQAASVAASPVADEERLDLSERLTEGLQGLARRSRLTLNTILQGAWAILLSRYSDLDDVVFGVSVSGRPAEVPDVERMVGFFLNTIPLRVQVPGTSSLLPWLRRLQDQQVEARRFETTPLIDIRRWSGLPPDRPLFESLLVFENFPIDAVLLRGDLLFRVEDVRSLEQTNFPLTLAVVPGERLSLRLSFDPKKIERNAMRPMLGHLEALLEAVAEAPEARISDLSLLTARERAMMLGAGVGPVEPSSSGNDPGAETIPQRFEAQAARSPAAVALTDSLVEFRYGELARRARVLAARLKRSGAGAETTVGIFGDRSCEAVLAMLAALRAGACYVPVDPNLPRARITELLGDCRPIVMLTLRRWEPECRTFGFPIFLIDEDPDLADGADSDAVPRIHPEQAAYVIYTSGSTGRPKGVQVPHRALANHAAAIAERFGLVPGDRVLHSSSLSFDVAAEEIFPTLISGATLVLRDDEAFAQPDRFWSWCRERCLTVLNLPTAWWHHLVDEFGEGDPSVADDVRLVVIGGEAASPRAVRTWLEQVPRRVGLVNAYGPTEATITATLGHVWPGDVGAAGDPDSPDDAVVPIGRPIPNVRAYVLDRHLNPQPTGLPGELYLAGAGLARGYQGLAGPTADRFLPDPFADEPGARMYRTGDRIRLRPDGRLEFLGRVDRQVKLRGYRIELDEVEVVLAGHPAVREVAVTAPISDELAAYITTRLGTSVHADDLRIYLAERLPQYALPQFISVLDEFPRTPGGKIDRSRLLPPDAACLGRAAYTPPSSPDERVLSGIWSEVLGIDRVGIHDDFFALGGHSLKAIQVAMRIRRAFGFELGLRTLFETRTVAELAQMIEAVRWARAGQDAVVGPEFATAREEIEL